MGAIFLVLFQGEMEMGEDNIAGIGRQEDIQEISVEEILEVGDYKLGIFYEEDRFQNPLIVCSFILEDELPVICKVSSVASIDKKDFFKLGWLPTIKLAIEMGLLYPRMIQNQPKKVKKYEVFLTGNEILKLLPFPCMNFGCYKKI